MRDGRRRDHLYRLRGDDTVRCIAQAQGDGITVSPVTLVAINGHLQLLRIRQLHRFTLVRVEVLLIPARQIYGKRRLNFIT